MAQIRERRCTPSLWRAVQLRIIHLLAAAGVSLRVGFDTTVDRWGRNGRFRNPSHNLAPRIGILDV